jgi:hypothetical protein
MGTTCIEYLIRSAAELGGSQGISVLVGDMLETGFMNKIMVNLHDAWEARQTTGPNRKQSKLNTITQGDYLAILARIILAEPNLFVQMLSTFGNIEEVWSWLSAEWFAYQSRMDNIERQKLYLLGLTRLLELNSPIQELVLGKLQDYLDLWINVIMDLQDGVVDGTDCLIWETEIEVFEYDAPRLLVERESQHKDPVHCVNALQFVKARLQDVIARIGGQEVFHGVWAVNVDKDVMEAFQKMMDAASQ